MDKKLSLKQRITFTSRGYKILNKYCPGLIKYKTLLLIISNLQPFVNIWLSAHIINELSTTLNIRLIILYVICIVSINFISSVMTSIINKVSGEKENQMWNFFRKIFSDKQVSMDYTNLENAKIQHQKAQTEEDLFMFGNGLGQLVWSTNGLVVSLVNILVSISMIVTLFTSQSGNALIDSPVWIIVIFASIVLSGVCNSRAFKSENKIFEKWCKETVWFNRVFNFYGWKLYSDIERAKDLRIYQQSVLADKELSKMLAKDKKGDKYIFLMAIFNAIPSLIAGIISAGCYVFIVLKAFFGAFGVGSIVQYVSVLGRLSEGIRGFIFSFSDNAVSCRHLQGLFDFLDIPNEQIQGERVVNINDKSDYCIEFRNVSFKYPETNYYALKDINLTINSGQRLAIVGMNGSGKTTLIKLLCRLYDPSYGEITLNDININEYEYADYLCKISVVLQDFQLLAFPLGQNIATSIDVDEVKAIDSLEKVGFKTRLASLEEGINTPLYKDFDEAGVEISGGEAQKIALARALYKDALIIVLDEPTASLDPHAELEIYSMLNNIMKNKTAFFISHRLSSCKFCDKVAVFHEGELIQLDSHDNLLENKNGKYYEMWEAQIQYYK